MRKPRAYRRGRAALLLLPVVLLASSGAVAQAALDGLLGVTDTLELDLGSLLNPVAPPVTGTNAGFSAAASGAVIHAGGLGLVALDVAGSAAGATVGASGPATGDLGRVEIPALPAQGSYGRGAGVSTGLGSGGLSASSSSESGTAEAKAPPNSGVVRHEAAPLTLAGLISGGLLRGEAEARSATVGCVLGADLSTGRGEAADVALLNVADMPGTPDVALSHSVSRTLVVAGGEGNLALRSETRQRISPVTFLAGTPNQFTVDTAGEWVLRAEADGRNASLSFGPADGGGVGRTVRVVDATGRTLAEGRPGADGSGVRLQIPGVAEVVVGGGPRRPGGSEAASISPTGVAAAVDLVRVKVLGADVRVGHMEASVSVPPTGVQCPPVESAVTAPAGEIEPGTEFPFSIRIANPNDGPLTIPALTARLAADGVAYEVVSEDGAEVAGGAAVWRGITVAPGGTAERRARVRVSLTSGPGRFRIESNGDGAYGPPSGSTAEGGVVPAAVRASADGPTVVSRPQFVEVAAPPGPAPARPTAARVPAAPVAPRQDPASRPTTSSTPEPIAAPAPVLAAPPPAPAPLPESAPAETPPPPGRDDKRAPVALPPKADGGDEDERGWWAFMALSCIAAVGGLAARASRSPG